jgi:peptide/nickel transport system substrate-binding protein
MVAIGEADLAPNIAKQDANSPDLDSSYLNTETTTLRIGGAWEPPLNDKRIRLAMNLAVDRNAIRGTILSKDAIPATQVIGPNVSGYNPDLKVPAYDPQKAKQLIDEARKDGVPVDKEMLLVARIGQFANIEDLEQALINMYKAVGLNFKLKMVEQAVYISYRDQPFPRNIGPYIGQFQTESSGDAGFTVFPKYHCKGSNSNICDKEVDDLIEKAQVATGDQRKKLWQAMFKRVQEEIIPEVMLFHMVAYARIGKRIDFKATPALSLVLKLSQIAFK